MNVLELRVAGLRGFNDRQTIELAGQLVIYTGPNGAGKTSIGECLEWLLYGKTLKRSRGDEISKREYADSYKNAHYSAPDNPFVEADVIDPSGAKRVVRRELIDGEGSVLTIDGTRANGLEELGIGTPYDRPLILQHTLQDFIFMKPKTRYEVLSAMLGLEPLIAFRNAVDQAKTNLNRSLPARIVEAQAYSATLGRSFQQEPLLRPVLLAIQQGDLKEAHKHLIQVALGRVAAGTTETDLRPALQSVKSSKERAQLDWGRFSLNPVPRPESHQAISGLGVIDGLLEDFHQQLETAQAAAQPQSEEPSQPTVREFIKLGLQIRLFSRICGLIPVPEGVPTCDKGLFP